MATGKYTLPPYPGWTALPCVIWGTRDERASSRPVSASRKTTLSNVFWPGISAPGMSVPTQTR